MALTDAPLRTDHWDALEPGREIHLTYDPQLDLFAARVGEPREAISIEYPDGMVARADPESRELLAVELYDFHALFLKRHPESTASWEDFTRNWTLLDRLRNRLGLPVRKTVPSVSAAPLAATMAHLIHSRPS